MCFDGPIFCVSPSETSCALMDPFLCFPFWNLMCFGGPKNLMCFDGPKTSCFLMDPLVFSPSGTLMCFGGPKNLMCCDGPCTSYVLMDPKGPSKHISAKKSVLYWLCSKSVVILTILFRWVEQLMPPHLFVNSSSSQAELRWALFKKLQQEKGTTINLNCLNWASDCYPTRTWIGQNSSHIYVWLSGIPLLCLI